MVEILFWRISHGLMTWHGCVSSQKYLEVPTVFCMLCSFG